MINAVNGVIIRHMWLHTEVKLSYIEQNRILVHNLFFWWDNFKKGRINMGKFDEIFVRCSCQCKSLCICCFAESVNSLWCFKAQDYCRWNQRRYQQKLRELGALTYKSEVHGTDNSQQIKLIVSEISDLKDNLDVVNEHIAVAKDQRRCPGCNAVIPKNSVFCNICGIKIDDTDEDFALCIFY